MPKFHQFKSQILGSILTKFDLFFEFFGRYYSGGLERKITTKNSLVNRTKFRYDHKYCRKFTGLGDLHNTVCMMISNRIFIKVHSVKK